TSAYQFARFANVTKNLFLVTLASIVLECGSGATGSVAPHSEQSSHSQPDHLPQPPWTGELETRGRTELKVCFTICHRPLIAAYHFVIMSCLFLLMTLAVSAADDRVDYVKQIRPILRERCVACHGVLKQEAGLRLDTAALAIKGGDSGTAIEP